MGPLAWHQESSSMRVALILCVASAIVLLVQSAAIESKGTKKVDAVDISRALEAVDSQLGRHGFTQEAQMSSSLDRKKKKGSKESKEKKSKEKKSKEKKSKESSSNESSSSSSSSEESMEEITITL